MRKNTLGENTNKTEASLYSTSRLLEDRRGEEGEGTYLRRLDGAAVGDEGACRRLTGEAFFGLGGVGAVSRARLRVSGETVRPSLVGGGEESEGPTAASDGTGEDTATESKNASQVNNLPKTRGIGSAVLVTTSCSSPTRVKSQGTAGSLATLQSMPEPQVTINLSATWTIFSSREPHLALKESET